MDLLIVVFGVMAILGLASVVYTLRGLCRLLEQLPDKDTIIGLIEELHEIRSSIEGISQKIREDDRREEIEPGVWALAEDRDQGNPDLIEVLEAIRDK